MRRAISPRPLTFDRIIALDTFQFRADSPKVVNIICLHNDFGQGRLVRSMYGSHAFAFLYMTWVCF